MITKYEILILLNDENEELTFKQRVILRRNYTEPNEYIKDQVNLISDNSLKHYGVKIIETKYAFDFGHVQRYNGNEKTPYEEEWQTWVYVEKLEGNK